MAVDPVVYENTEFVKEIGLKSGPVVAFNPDRYEIGKLLGKSEDDVKDPKYEGTDEDGNRKLRLDIWIQTGPKDYKRVKLYLVDKIHESKSGKLKFIDKKGNMSYFVEDESKLPEFMQNNSPWKARIGETSLYRFLQAFMSVIDRKKAATFCVDWDKIMDNNMKELNGFIGQPYVNDVAILMMVKAEKKEGEIVEYQEFWNQHFLAGDDLKFFTNRGIEEKNKRIKEFVKEATDKEYGPKHYYGGTLGIARTYVQEENPIVARLLSDSPYPTDEEDDDFSVDYD